MNEKGRQTKLLAAVAILVMVVCVFAVAIPSNGVDATAPTYADNADIQRGDLATENATVSFYDSEGAEWDYKNGNTVPITNSSLGNTNMNITVDANNKSVITISGNLMGQPEGSQYYLTGAPSEFEYGFVFNLADVVDSDGSYGFGTADNAVYIGYENANEKWKVLEKKGTTSTQLVYIDAERASGSTTYYFSDETIAEDATDGLKSFTVNYDFNLIPYNTYQDMIYRGDISTQNATVSFIDSEGAEWDYKNGNTTPITNSSLGNYDMDMQRVNSTTVIVSGTLANQAENNQFTATGAPSGFEYGFVFNLADVVDSDGSYGFGTADNAVYIGYYNAEGDWKVLEKKGSTSTQLVYIDAERASGSTTYYFSNETIAEEATEGLDSFTVQYDFKTTQTVTDQKDVNDALENNDVVVINNIEITQTLTVPANTTLVFGDNVRFGMNAAITLSAQGATAQIGDITTISSFEINNGTGGSTVEVKDFKGTGVSITYGSVTIDGEELSGTINVTEEVLNLSGSTETESGEGNGLIINADGGTTVNIASNMEINGDGLTINRTSTGAVTVNASDIILNNSSSITINSAVNMTAGELTGTGTVYVNAGAIFTYSSKASNVIIDNSDGGIVKIEGAQGTENIISNDQTFDGYRYLSQDTIIQDGVTVTIAANSTLNLMGFDLKIYGDLVIERNAVITSMNNADAGTITLMSTGSIQNNNGVIGDTMAITIVNGENSEVQTVSMQGVKGVNLSMDRDSDNRNVYNMFVSGDVSRVTGTDVHKLTVTNVDIDANMTIGSSVEFYVAGITDVAKNVMFTNNGAYMEIDDTYGKFVLGNGASAVINAPTKGTITVQVGEIESGDEFVLGTPDESAVTLDGNRDGSGSSIIYKGTTGITVSVGRITVPNEDDATTSNVYQQMYVNGTLDFTNNDRGSNADKDGTVDFTGTVFVTDTLTALENITISFTDDGYFDVSEAGTVVLNNGNVSSFNYYGAKYIIETTVENAPVETTYYTNFTAAMDQIATAQDNLVTVSGVFEISGTYDLTGEQAIEVVPGSQITVGEDSTITVGVDASIDNTAFYTIEGRVIVTEGVGYRPSATVAGTNHYIYAVKTTAEDNTTTYSGFKIALDNAAAGQTITVVGNAEYDGNLVIPAQVTVDVNENIILTVLGNVTIEAEGKLILDNNAQLVVGKENSRDYTITVNGTVDATDGGKISKNADNTGSVNMYSAGTTSVVGDSITDVTVNAAYYSDAGETVYTSVANAIAYAEENALPSVSATGTFSETGTIESDGVNIIIALNSVVTLGDVTLTGAQISVAQPASGNTTDKAGQYTASVSGLTGAGDAATTSTVSVNKSSATIGSIVSINAEGVNQYVLNINNLASATIEAGTVTYIGGDVSFAKDAGLQIDSGATLLIGASVGFAGSYITNNGTIQIDEGETVTASGTIPGNVFVPADATLFVTDSGELIITGTVNVDAEGTFTMNGTLQVGKTPSLLTASATGAVVGNVALDEDAIVYAFAGSDMSAAEFTNSAVSEVKSTAYSINGVAFVTVYTFGTETIGNTIVNGFVNGLKDLYTPDTVDENNATMPYSATWYSGNSNVTGSNIGDYAEVNTEIRYNTVGITVSMGSHISVSIDNIIVDSYNGFEYPLAIGTHTVNVTVDPGYSGDVAITFNGQTVQNGGTIEVTSDMMDSIDDIVLSATGQLTADTPEIVIPGGSSSDDGMGLTDYLLIILVILIVIMAIMVAFRLMRS